MSQIEMTCEQVADLHDAVFEDIMQEQYWEGGINTQALAETLEIVAREAGIKITDLETYDLDKHFFNWYHCIEKGLS